MLSEAYKRKLNTCHPDLIRLIEETDKRGINMIVADGHRNWVYQTIAYRTGHSRLKYPDSAHNQKPSYAVDIYPEGYDFEKSNTELFDNLISEIKRIAKELEIRIDCGYDWKEFIDMPHIELAEFKELKMCVGI